jgi:hypothetical protein
VNSFTPELCSKINAFACSLLFHVDLHTKSDGAIDFVTIMIKPICSCLTWSPFRPSIFVFLFISSCSQCIQQREVGRHMLGYSHASLLKVNIFEAIQALSHKVPLYHSSRLSFSLLRLENFHFATRLRGGYRNSDILKQYILVSSKAGPNDGDGSALERAALAMPPDADAMHQFGVFLLDRKANTTGAEAMFRYCYTQIISCTSVPQFLWSSCASIGQKRTTTETVCSLSHATNLDLCSHTLAYARITI